MTDNIVPRWPLTAIPNHDLVNIELSNSIRTVHGSLATLKPQKMKNVIQHSIYYSIKPQIIRELKRSHLLGHAFDCRYLITVDVVVCIIGTHRRLGLTHEAVSVSFSVTPMSTAEALNEIRRIDTASNSFLIHEREICGLFRGRGNKTYSLVGSQFFRGSGRSTSGLPPGLGMHLIAAILLPSTS